MHTVKALEFKAKCLKLMDLVQKTNEEIIITKNGKPVSRLLPYHTQATTLFGLHSGEILSKDDLVSPVDEQWDADH